MKYSLFFSFLVLLNAYFHVQCGLFTRVFDALFAQPPPELDKVALVLGIDDDSGYSVIANVPILVTNKDPNFRKYLFLCSAEDDEEEDINEERSKTKNTLFIRQTYGDLKFDDTKKKRRKSREDKSKLNQEDFDIKHFQYLEYDCNRPLNPSVQYAVTDKNYGIDIFLIGFEVFVDKKYKGMKTVDYAKFLKLDTPDFRWYNVLTVRFDKQNGNVLSSNAEVFNDLSTFLSPRYEFSDYSLDPNINTLHNEMFYEGVNVETLYSLENQKFVFDQLFEDPSIKNLYFNIIQQRYLVKNHLSPVQGFVTTLLEKSAHTYGNIAAMWKIIKEKSWNKVETQIKYLVQGIYGVHLITGTYGTLKLNKKKIHLGFEGTVRVPLAFWKLVQYTRKERQFYNMLIVTVNNPYEKVPVDLCPISQCKQYGWEYIEQDFHPWGRTLCCEVTKENMTLLQLEDYIKPDRILNLREVPHLEDEQLTLNLTKFIEDRKKQPVFDISLKADHVEYRNQKDFVLFSEKKDDKSNENDFSVIKFITWIIKDHAIPYIDSVFTQRRGSSGLSEKEQPLLDEQNGDVEDQRMNVENPSLSYNPFLPQEEPMSSNSNSEIEEQKITSETGNSSSNSKGKNVIIPGEDPDVPSSSGQKDSPPSIVIE